MEPMVLLLAVLLVVGGGVWLAQGLNLPFAPGSFMSGDPVWVVVGAAAVLGGVVIGARELASRREEP